MTRLNKYQKHKLRQTNLLHKDELCMLINVPKLTKFGELFLYKHGYRWHRTFWVWFGFISTKLHHAKI